MKEYAIFYLDHVGFQKLYVTKANNQEEAVAKFRKGSRQHSTATILEILSK